MHLTLLTTECFHRCIIIKRNPGEFLFFLSLFTFYPLPRGKYTSMYNYKFVLLISNTVIHIMNCSPCFRGSVFAAFDRTDASITYKTRRYGAQPTDLL